MNDYGYLMEAEPNRISNFPMLRKVSGLYSPMLMSHWMKPHYG